MIRRLALVASLGFVPSEPFSNNPIPGVLFFERNGEGQDLLLVEIGEILGHGSDRSVPTSATDVRLMR